MRITDAQSPARDIQLVDSLVSEIAVAVIPKPVPVVVKAILGEVVFRRGSEPLVIMNTRGYRLRRRAPDGVAPLIAKAARVIDVTDQPVVHLLNCVANGYTGA